MFRRLMTIAVGGLLGTAMLAIVTLRVGALFGVGPRLDAYLAAVSGPSLLLSLMGAVIAPALTPRLATRAPADAARRAGEWALIAFLAGAILAAAIAATRTWLMALIAPGLSGPSAHLAAHILAIYAISLPATLASGAYSAYGFANGRVWTSGGSSTVYGLTWLGLLFLHPFTRSLTDVAVACVVASQIQLVCAFVCSKRKIWPWPRFGAPGRPWLALATVLGIGLNVALGKANILLDPMFGSLVGKGDVSLLVYATRITLLIIAICGQGPAFAVLGGRRSADERGNPLASSGFGVMIIVACGLATAIAIVFQPVAGLLLAHGAFTPAAARHVGRIVEAYAPAIVLTGVAWSLESTLYSLGYSWRLVLFSAPSLLVNVGLSVILLPSLGVMARPIAVGTSMMLYAVLLGAYLRRLPEGFDPLSKIPTRATGAVIAAVAALSLAARFGGNKLVHAPTAWSVSALLLIVVLLVLTARIWLRERDAVSAHVVRDQRLDAASFQVEARDELAANRAGA